jgi:hypothetical protein
MTLKERHLRETRIAATCSLGLGFSYQGFRAALEQKPHLIACDAGSSDFGPYYLGVGLTHKSAVTIKRDLRLLLEGARELGVPFITGSAGGAGGDAHLDATVALVREVAAEAGLHFKLASISAQLSPAILSAKVAVGAMKPLGGVPDLTLEKIAGLSATVGMMGVEPFVKALEMGAEVIVAGRSTDPAIFAAVALRDGFDPGLVWHAAKSIDKGYLATTRPHEGSPVLARIREDHFTVEPTRENSECRVSTLASITMHENPDPYRVVQPTGTIDTQQTIYTQLDHRTVKVSGSRFTPAQNPTIKIEGASLVGYREILIAGLRDPRLITKIDEFLAAYRQALAAAARSMKIEERDYLIQFRVYGRDAVMGAYEPLAHQISHELGLVVDVVGRTPEIASAIGSRLGGTGTRLDIGGGLGGGGNFAYPFSPSLIKVGPVYEWGAWHIMDVDQEELTGLFPITMYEI